MLKAWNEFQKKSMDRLPILVSTLINKECFANTLLDIGYLLYRLIDSRFVYKYNLLCISISPRSLTAFNSPAIGEINEVVVVQIDINGHIEDRAFFYIIPQLENYNIILDLPWFRKQDIRLYPKHLQVEIRSTDTIIENRSVKRARKLDYRSVLAVVFTILSRKSYKRPATEVFSVTLADIEKALTRKPITDPKLKLTDWNIDFLDLFNPREAEKLLLLRGLGIDYYIELEKVDGKDLEVL